MEVVAVLLLLRLDAVVVAVVVVAVVQEQQHGMNFRSQGGFGFTSFTLDKADELHLDADEIQNQYFSLSSKTEQKFLVNSWSPDEL